MIRAIIFDLDGTLAESKSPLTHSMGELLARLLVHIPVAIMSGGSYTQFEKQLLVGMPPHANYGNLYLFPTSAGQCRIYRDGRWESLYSNVFTPEQQTAVLRALNESLRETGLDKPPAHLWGKQIEDRGPQITWSSLGQQAPIEEKRAWDPDRSKRLPLQTALLKRLPGFSVRVNATNSIDITREGITKAYGVRRFSDIVEITIQSMLYVGDGLFPGGNDEVVEETGIKTRAVSGPSETAAVIEEVLATLQ